MAPRSWNGNATTSANKLTESTLLQTSRMRMQQLICQLDALEQSDMFEMKMWSSFVGPMCDWTLVCDYHSQFGMIYTQQEFAFYILTNESAGFTCTRPIEVYKAKLSASIFLLFQLVVSVDDVTARSRVQSDDTFCTQDDFPEHMNNYITLDIFSAKQFRITFSLQFYRTPRNSWSETAKSIFRKKL